MYEGMLLGERCGGWVLWCLYPCRDYIMLHGGGCVVDVLIF